MVEEFLFSIIKIILFDIKTNDKDEIESEFLFVNIFCILLNNILKNVIASPPIGRTWQSLMRIRPAMIRKFAKNDFSLTNLFSLRNNILVFLNNIFLIRVILVPSVCFVLSFDSPKERTKEKATIPRLRSG